MLTTSTQLISKFKPLFEPIRFKIFFGGRGGLKSWSIAQALIIQATQKKQHILCARELQNSITESVHKLLCDTIVRLGLESQFTIIANKITHENGSTFIFKGLKNSASMKSFEGISRVWLEEADTVSDDSWDILLPTIRTSGSEVWASFNPQDPLDPTYARFVAPYIDELTEHEVYRDDDIYVCYTSYKDNPWLSPELEKERLNCKAQSYTRYEHIWLGQPVGDYEDSIIQPEWINAAIDAHIKLDWKPRGTRVLGYDPADGGNDAKAFVERYGSLVNNAAQWKTGDLEDGTVKAYTAATLSNCSYIVYDNIGIGAGARIILNRLNTTKIQPQGFCASESPEYPWVKYKEGANNRDVFKNRRAQGYWYLRDRFEATYRAVVKGEDIDPDDMISLSSKLPFLKQLRSELSKIRRKISRTDNNLIQIESKADMKSRGVKSPNLADALVYSFSNTVVRKQNNKPPMRFGHK